jgi:hypothetical protein
MNMSDIAKHLMGAEPLQIQGKAGDIVSGCCIVTRAAHRLSPYRSFSGVILECAIKRKSTGFVLFFLTEATLFLLAGIGLKK